MKTGGIHALGMCESHLMAGIVAAKGCGGRAYKNTLQQASLCVMKLIMERAKHIAFGPL